MRVNVYNEELPDHVSLTPRTANQRGENYYGIRFHLSGHPDNKITFWLKDKTDTSPMSDSERFANLLYNAARMIQNRQHDV